MSSGGIGFSWMECRNRCLRFCVFVWNQWGQQNQWRINGVSVIDFVVSWRLAFYNVPTLRGNQDYRIEA
mgnify:CR=1 FL=1